MTIAESSCSTGAVESGETARMKPGVMTAHCDGAGCVHFIDDIFVPLAALPEQLAARHEEAGMIFDRR